ncbi:MAG: hypothetical protein ORN50_01365 [Crocinitomicaceae bacterium]|jgi:hypothetical protein|nr:hypothetical protein [Crocinitomicaceae bacterium]
MIKSIEEKQTALEIDLTGPDGNVFNLIGIGGRLCKQLGLNSEMFTRRMMSGDYENALATFEEYFGDYVILYR